jgi:hypothetical protein
MKTEKYITMAKEYKRWVKEEPLDEGGTKRIEVEEVENGFIKTVSISNEEKYECKRYISEENPMEEKGLIEKLAEAMGARIKT